MEQQAGKHPEKSKLYEVRVDSMRLDEKIRHLHDILKTSSRFQDLNNCYDRIKELIVSNDGKFLFACIRY